MTSNADDTLVRLANGLLCGFRAYFNGLQTMVRVALPGLDAVARGARLRQ